MGERMARTMEIIEMKDREVNKMRNTKFNASHRYASSLLGALFSAAIMSLLSLTAHAQCSKIWDGSGEWEMHQGRGGTTVVRLNMKQSGNALDGTASRGGTKGKAFGTADGANFSLWIDWVDGSEYTVYRAQVPASGKLAGDMFTGPNKNRDTWYSDQPLTCGWSPGKSRGNLTSRLSADAPAQTGKAIASLAKGPTLFASPSVFPYPFSPTGFVVLTWDGGPDHPNADVWVKYANSRDRILVIKQPKGGFQVNVQRGQMYTYVLMDDRVVLATATFVAN